MGRDSYLEGEMRKRWHPHFLSNEESALRPQPSSPVVMDAPNDLAVSMQKEIENLKKRTEDHLKVPQVQTKSPYRKTRAFFMFLGMLFLAFLFFAVGFMACFSLFPPHSITNQASSELNGPSDQASYMVRQGIISGSSGSQSKPGLLSQIENQSAIAAQRRSQEAIAMTTDSINSKLRNVLGYRVESVLEPVTKGVASFLINQVGDPRVTGMSYNNQLGRGAVQPLQQQQAAQQQFQQQQHPQALSDQPKDVQGQMHSAVSVPRQGGISDGSPASSGLSNHGFPSHVVSGEGAPANPAPLLGANQHPGAAQGPSSLNNPPLMSKPHAAAASGAASGQPGLYAVEVSTFDQSQDAYVMMKDMKDSGYDAYIVRTVIGSKLLYHVRFGDFKTYHHARDAAGGYRSLWNLPARVAITSPTDDKMRFR